MTQVLDADVELSPEFIDRCCEELGMSPSSDFPLMRNILERQLYKAVELGIEAGLGVKMMRLMETKNDD